MSVQVRKQPRVKLSKTVLRVTNCFPELDSGSHNYHAALNKKEVSLFGPPLSSMRSDIIYIDLFMTMVEHRKSSLDLLPFALVKPPSLNVRPLPSLKLQAQQPPPLPPSAGVLVLWCRKRTPRVATDNFGMTRKLFWSLFGILAKYRGKNMLANQL
jgi:hypothetical protein